VQAFKEAGYKPGKDIYLTLDPAASEFYVGNAKYTFKKSTGETVTGDDLVSFYAKLCAKYPIVSIEDGCGESDWATWKKLTDKIGDKVQLVGDDLFVTNQLRPDQDRIAQPLRPFGEVQPTPAHRTVAWQERRLRRHECIAESAAVIKVELAVRGNPLGAE
jgi:hypothetical protein